MVDRKRLLRAAWDVWRAGRETLSVIAARQQARLADLGEDILTFESPSGGAVRLIPRAVARVVSEAPGVRRVQVIQAGPELLCVRLEIMPGADGRQVWETVARRLRDYLAAQGGSRGRGGAGLGTSQRRSEKREVSSNLGRARSRRAPRERAVDEGHETMVQSCSRSRAVTHLWTACESD